jgi:glycosyltransferase involved in cell wall biosynthesis
VTRRLVALNPVGLVGGAEVVLVRLLDALVDAGWSIHLVCPEGALADLLEGHDIEVTTIPTVTLAPGPVPVASARTAAATLRAARRLRRAARGADLVLGNGLMSLPTIQVAHLAAPTVWFIHDVATRRVQRAVARIGRSGADFVIAPSEASAASVRSFGIPVTVVRNGTPWPTEPGAPEGPPHLVGCAATLTPLKGQDVLLEAIASLGRRDLVVELAGSAAPKDGAYEAMLRERAGRDDLAGRVRFLGHVDDVGACMRRWRVAALPSVRPEAAALTVLESMSLGVPVVTTDHGGPPEFLDGAGLLVPPGDVASLATSIARLVDDDELWRRCSAAGRNEVAQALSLSAQCARIVAIFERLVAGRPHATV